ncbi:hypothetical protein M408DRAFT_136078 [Serendipita vermifera MAFF 305830]|uniref:Uncharacterized protein n=1 Tax=Serendipita vermifera MAFF 305830 TaxID=933852 RepID=A0A0C3AVD9_SERVB|nr:hypothetical protein M408DRAFT_136078 [Serendipita vermifera MAFF 305830]
MSEAASPLPESPLHCLIVWTTRVRRQSIISHASIDARSSKVIYGICKNISENPKIPKIPAPWILSLFHCCPRNRRREESFFRHFGRSPINYVKKLHQPRRPPFCGFKRVRP